MSKMISSFVAIAGVAGVLSTGFVASSQAAETVDMGAYSCSDYLNASIEDQDLVLLWIDGYLSHKTSDLVISSAAMTKNHAYVEIACADQPSAPVIDVLLSGLPE
ncbi:MAG: HdeA/HdeB family chaperone [Pseudomonadota bacterium]